MFGMLLATLYEAERAVTPSAYAIAHVRTNPVIRDAAVDTDIIAVERAIDGWVAIRILLGKGRSRAPRSL